MTYIAGSPQRICGVDYKPGDAVPQGVIGKLKTNVVSNMLTRGRLKFIDESAPVPPPEQEPKEEWTYKGGGWWVASNGMKTRGPADRPPALTGAS
jgi:hypothetical protein